MSELGTGGSEGDRAEQAQPADNRADGPDLSPIAEAATREANPADVAEQKGEIPDAQDAPSDINAGQGHLE